jgi:amidase
LHRDVERRDGLVADQQGRLDCQGPGDREGPDLVAQCRAISLTGLPSLAIPVTPTASGRSVSAQLVGPPGGDRQCCVIAAELGACVS